MVNLAISSVTSGIERTFHFASLPENAVCETKKSLHVAIGFTLALHGHMLMIGVSR